MMTKSWPAQMSCKKNVDVKVKRSKISSKEEVNDRLSALPDEIMFLILSSFSMKEVARLSIVSQRLKYIWLCFPRLHFEDLMAIERISKTDLSVSVFSHERSSFVTWVNSVLDQHLGATIDELTIKYLINVTCQSHVVDVDKWLVFASEKRVRKLEFDFASIYYSLIRELPPCTLPLNVASIKSSLISLRLRFVEVTNELVHCVLCSCVLLENLSVIYSNCLTKLRVSGSLQRLKHLEVSSCHHLKIIDICTPNLVSFTHRGKPIKLHIRQASLLSMVTVGGRGYNCSIARAIDPLSQFFSQLEYLSLMMSILYCKIDNPPALTNLKHLELCFIARCHQTLLGWTSLIVASPVLQKLTLRLSKSDINRARPVKHSACPPLKCLKTLELFGFMGSPIDLEFAAFVLENAIALEEVIVDFTPLFASKPDNKGAQARLVELEMKLPRGVKLIVK